MSFSLLGEEKGFFHSAAALAVKARPQYQDACLLSAKEGRAVLGEGRGNAWCEIEGSGWGRKEKICLP